MLGLPVASNNSEKPFDDPIEGPKSREWCVNAVDSVLGKDWIQGVNKAATEIQAITRGRNDRKRVADVSKTDEICIKNEKMFIKNEELCNKNEDICIFKLWICRRRNGKPQ